MLAEQGLVKMDQMHFLVHSQDNSGLYFSSNCVFEMGSKQELLRKGR
jgi:hypothetical protein